MSTSNPTSVQLAGGNLLKHRTSTLYKRQILLHGLYLRRSGRHCGIPPIVPSRQRDDSVKCGRWRRGRLFAVAVPKVVARRKMVRNSVQRYVCQMTSQRQVDGANLYWSCVIVRRWYVIPVMAPARRRRVAKVIWRDGAKSSVRQFSVPAGRHWQCCVVVGRTVTLGGWTYSPRQWGRAEVYNVTSDWRLPRRWIMLRVVARFNRMWRQSEQTHMH